MSKLFNNAYRAAQIRNNLTDFTVNDLLAITIKPLFDSSDTISLSSIPIVEFIYINKENIINRFFGKSLFPSFTVEYPELKFEEIAEEILQISQFACIRSKECYVFIINIPEYINISTSINQKSVYTINFNVAKSKLLSFDITFYNRHFKILKCTNPIFLTEYAKYLKEVSNIKNIMENSLKDLSDEEKLLLELDE